jgi:hypothetical protein
MKVPLADTSKASYSGKRLTTEVMVTGKAPTPYIIPKRVGFKCEDITPSAKCQLCRNNESRIGELTISASQREILEILGKSDRFVAAALQRWVGVCDACHVVITETQNVEELRVSPNVSTFVPNAEYVTRECYYLGHGLRPNRPYEITCYCYPSPQEQRAVLVADTAVPLRDQLETFAFEKAHESLEIFRAEPGKVFDDVYADFTSNVHRIVGRKDLQIAFDLCFHSVLQFKFQNVLLRKGWVEALILGDSGQGKTEMSLCLLNHYSLGDRVQGEGSSTAGLIGGVERLGDRWILVWGRIPQMDRRLLIIDEFAGVNEEDIAKMSDIRSTGVAEITKIRTERASARTRLIMMSNTRDGQPLSAYNTGVEAIKSVFTHSEDIRRLEFAVCVASGEVAEESLNAPRESKAHKYVSQACRDLILWAWSLNPESVLFEEGVEALILQRASDLSTKYSASIPLVEPADMRLKLARLSVSCACRCFSADEKGRVIIKPEHVEFVSRFLCRCYDSATMSYNTYSERADQESIFSDGELEASLAELRKLPEWKRTVDILERIDSPFRLYELGQQLGLEEYEAKDIIKFLSGHRMIKNLPVGYRKQPKLNAFLREAKR